MKMEERRWEFEKMLLTIVGAGTAVMVFLAVFLMIHGMVIL
jgi:hypothetical protein